MELVRRQRPDVVLMDIRMPGIDGLEATRRINETPTGRRKVLVLTTFELDEYVFEALRAGASGFLVKHTEPADLVRAVRVVAAGEALLSPSVTRRLIAEFTRPPVSRARRRIAELLTAREREVVALVAEAVQRRDRRAVGGEPGHRAHPRQPGDDQAQRPRPRPARRVRLPHRPGGDPTTAARVVAAAISNLT